MNEKLKDLPLFNGQDQKLKAEYDFTFPPGFNQAVATFLIERSTADDFKDFCHKKNLDPNAILEKLIGSFLKESQF